MQAADVDPVLREQRDDGPGARRVRGDVAVDAPHEQFAQVALARLVGQLGGERSGGPGERGHRLRIDTRGVLGQDETVGVRREGARELRHPGSEPAQLLQDPVLSCCHQVSPLGADPLPLKGPPAHP